MKRIKNNLAAVFAAAFVSLILFILYNTYQRVTSPLYVPNSAVTENSQYTKIVFSGGCFWCTEAEFDHVKGVVSAISGFAEASKANPSYAEVSNEAVKAREAVLVIYDSKQIDEKKLLEIYWKHINPSDAGGQFADRGYQYTTAIYYTTALQKQVAEEQKSAIDNAKKFPQPVVTEILPFVNFYPAEEYHQHYKDRNPVRYAVYREASGRNTFIKNNWTDQTFLEKVFGSHMTQTMNNQGETNMTGVTESWKNFTDEVKATKLKTLTPLQYSVTQNGNTERSFDNEYAENKEKGIYVDIVSGEPLYLSSDKYNSGTGWPSFVRPVSSDVVVLRVEKGFFTTRTEVRSKIADSHLGHVFDDGPQSLGGKRYCMNSAALRFVPFANMEKEGYGEYVAQIQ